MKKDIYCRSSPNPLKTVRPYFTRSFSAWAPKDLGPATLKRFLNRSKESRHSGEPCKCGISLSDPHFAERWGFFCGFFILCFNKTLRRQMIMILGSKKQHDRKNCKQNDCPAA